MIPRYAITLLIALSSAFLTTATAQERPNIILIMADDLGWTDLGCFGSPDIATPHIDKMAMEGMRLTSFYAQPICGPSRTALMTGSYPYRVAQRDNKKKLHPDVHPREILISELLKKKSYRTGVIGKWDLNGHSNKFAADEQMPKKHGL